MGARSGSLRRNIERGESIVDIPHIIASNITALRKNANMTQAGLAERIGYSDKSVSKWERADGIPDVVCLKAIADLFGVTVDYMLTEEHPAVEGETTAPEALPEVSDTTEQQLGYTTDHIAVSLVSIAGVWLIAFAVYIIMRLCGIPFGLSFVIACPISAVLLIVFNALWGKSRLTFWYVSLLVWSLLFLICYSARAHDIWLLMCIGFPATLVVWLSCRVRSPIPVPDMNNNMNNTNIDE